MTAKRKTTAAQSQPTSTVVSGIKGYDKDLACHPHGGPRQQYEVGKTYKHDGPVKACKSGFHAITGHPLAVLAYYPPSKSRYTRVDLSGALDSDDNIKTAAEILTVGKELSQAELAAEAVKWVFDRAKWSEGPVATGDNEGATASGRYGAATASGEYGAATASGEYGAATASGEYGAATASGFNGKARGAEGCALFLVERLNDPASGEHDKIIAVWAGIVGQDGIKPDTWYSLKDGKPVEVDA